MWGRVSFWGAESGGGVVKCAILKWAEWRGKTFQWKNGELDCS